MLNRFDAVKSNKYLWVSLAFILWLVFVDRNDLIDQWSDYKKVQSLKETERYYKKETQQLVEQMNELNASAASKEKFAREKYRMKKEDEDLFVIVPESDNLSPDEQP